MYNNKYFHQYNDIIQLTLKNHNIYIYDRSNIEKMVDTWFPKELRWWLKSGHIKLTNWGTMSLMRVKWAGTCMQTIQQLNEFIHKGVLTHAMSHCPEYFLQTCQHTCLVIVMHFFSFYKETHYCGWLSGECIWSRSGNHRLHLIRCSYRYLFSII